MRKMIVALAATAVVFGTAGTATAGSGNLGAKTCNFGSVSTQAYGQYNITFNAYVPNLGGALTVQRTGSITAAWKYAYWSAPAGQRVDYASSGSASNSGTLSNLAWFCDN